MSAKTQPIPPTIHFTPPPTQPTTSPVYGIPIVVPTRPTYTTQPIPPTQHFTPPPATPQTTQPTQTGQPVQGVAGTAQTSSQVGPASASAVLSLGPSFGESESAPTGGPSPYQTASGEWIVGDGTPYRAVFATYAEAEAYYVSTVFPWIQQNATSIFGPEQAAAAQPKAGGFDWKPLVGIIIVLLIVLGLAYAFTKKKDHKSSRRHRRKRV